MNLLDGKEIKALCLDIDGTLYPRWMLDVCMICSVLPVPLLGMAYRFVRKRYRVEQERQAPPSEDRAGFTAMQARLALQWLHRPVDGKAVSHLQHRIEHRIYHPWQRMFRSILPYSGMRDVLVLCRSRGISIGVLSDFPLGAKLETLGIADLVDFAYSAEDTGYLKPNHHAFEPLLHHFGFPASRILYMGDSYDKDVLGAKQLGMRTCLLSKSRKPFPEADHVVHSWKEFSNTLC